jgi:hypothetical protein
MEGHEHGDAKYFFEASRSLWLRGLAEKIASRHASLQI